MLGPTFLISLALATQPAVIVLPPPAHAEAPAVAAQMAAAPTAPVAAALEAWNAGRAKVGVPPFVLDARLCKAAQVHSDDMASGKVPMGHDGFSARVVASGFPMIGKVAEGVFPLDTGLDPAYWVDWLLAPRQAREAHSLDYRNPTFNTVGIGVGNGTGGDYPGYLTVIYATTVPVGPTPPPVPVPGPCPPCPPVVIPPVVPPTGPAPSDAMTAAAASYMRGIPGAGYATADEIEAGRIETPEAARDAIASARQGLAEPMLRLLSAGWATVVGPDGKFTDRRAAADHLRALAKAQEAALGKPSP